MALPILPYAFTFGEREDRIRVTLSDNQKIWIGDNDHAIRLRLGQSGYPTDTNLTATLWAWHPVGARQWLCFDAQVEIPERDNVADGTIRWRLGDGTSVRWWNGTAWAVATTSAHWNTLEEIADHFTTFPITSRIVQPIVKIATTYAGSTPCVRCVKIAYRGDYIPERDCLNNGLLVAMRAGVTTTTDHQFKAKTGATTYDFMSSDYKLDAEIAVSGVEFVYNLTQDPSRTTNLFSSYTAGVLTLTVAPHALDVIEVRFIVTPLFAITTDEDYDDVQRVPSVALTDISCYREWSFPFAGEIVNRGPAHGPSYEFGLVRQRDYDATIEMKASSTLDLQALKNAVARWLSVTACFNVPSMDINLSFFAPAQGPGDEDMGLGGIHSSRCGIRIMGVPSYDDGRVAYPVRRLLLTGDLSETIE